MVDMELNTLKDAFDIVAKKQELRCSKTHQVIDQMRREIHSATLKCQSVDNDHRTILGDLKNKLNEIDPVSQLKGYQKDIMFAVSKYDQLVKQNFNLDASQVYKDDAFDPSTVELLEQIIGSHLYRHGLFDLGDFFIVKSKEVSNDAIATLKQQFLEMYRILDAARAGNLEPALNWAAMHQEQLLQNRSSLEVKLQQLKAVEILQKQDMKQGLDYVKKHLTPTSSIYKVNILSFTTACLAFKGKFDQSPHGAEFLSEINFDKVIEELTRQYCSSVRRPYASPLAVVVAAGCEGLPTLLNTTALMKKLPGAWDLPVTWDLGAEFQFHSIFVCPYLHDQSSAENTPVMMPCGHVVGKQCILEMTQYLSQQFECALCKETYSVDACRDLHL